MRHWIKDAHFRSLLKNSSYLGVSKAVAAVAGIATLAFAGRGLGVTLFGMLILIVSYAKAASGLSKFQSWQLIVRYGGRALAGGGCTAGGPECCCRSRVGRAERVGEPGLRCGPVSPVRRRPL
jgi:hypothetical protein